MKGVYRDRTGRDIGTGTGTGTRYREIGTVPFYSRFLLSSQKMLSNKKSQTSS